jgi:amidohydrolase
MFEPMDIGLLTKWRRDLHRIPELGFDLFKTHAYIKEALEEMGYVTRTVAKTGLVAIREGQSGKTVAFRSDMDALPVSEHTGRDFKSLHDGRMHACGHDGHMAMLLGFARHVADLPRVNDSVMFIFQPAEEGPGGAKVIIDEGLFERTKVDAIFGIHLDPGLDKGLIGLREGPMFARNGEFTITVRGKSGHAAMPHLSHDAIAVAGHLITQYHMIVSRSVDPLKQAVLTIGTVHGGEARNIVANTVTFEGTIRAFDDAVYHAIKNRIEAVNKGLEEAYSVSIDFGFIDYYPVLRNDPALVRMITPALMPEDITDITPFMFAEDFAFYQQVVPGVFSMLGVRDEGRGFIHPLHSDAFDFDEDVLARGVAHYDAVARALGVY